MSVPASTSGVLQNSAQAADHALDLLRLEARLPPLLSVIAGMVDLIGSSWLSPLRPSVQAHSISRRR
jgi:hypothetical protein